MALMLKDAETITDAVKRANIQAELDDMINRLKEKYGERVNVIVEDHPVQQVTNGGSPCN